MTPLRELRCLQRKVATLASIWKIHRTTLLNRSFPMFFVGCMRSTPRCLQNKRGVLQAVNSFTLSKDSDLRRFYGPTIGQIAHSHWWSVHKVEDELSEDLGALANRTHNLVDRVKLACLLRVADALHLDSRRAPRFLRTVTNPSGISSLHWDFQERLARPHIELDRGRLYHRATF